MVDAAHEHNIRVLFDVVANHTGPVTSSDSKWPEEWVRTGPRCTYTSAETTINCTLLDNLPDLKTESQQEVDLPPFLVEKWKSESRYDQEVKELDDWFEMTGYKRTPSNYVLKWIVDLIGDYGIDGYRVDAVKHIENDVWQRLWKQGQKAHKMWKTDHREAVIDDNDFYMLGEVNYFSASGGRTYDYGDEQVDFFDGAFTSMINFDFKGDANKSYEKIFSKYDKLLSTEFKGKGLVHCISCHDDGAPYDLNREQPFESGTKLLLAPGGVQIYYGDESARSLTADANGDASLRSFMNWDELRVMAQKNNYTVNDVLIHWQKLGNFRNNHPSIGAGTHKMISEKPYMFTRTWQSEQGHRDKVLVGLDMPKGLMTIDVSSIARDGETVTDTYSGISQTVSEGKVSIDSAHDIVLFEVVKM